MSEVPTNAELDAQISQIHEHLDMLSNADPVAGRGKMVIWQALSDELQEFTNLRWPQPVVPPQTACGNLMGRITNPSDD
jgi:hypothetical protein